MRRVPSFAISPALVAAIAFAATTDPEPCPACADPANAGLCHAERCERHVLPVLKPPRWHRDAHSGKYHETGKAKQERSAAAKKADRRDARKQVKAAERLGLALGGAHFTRTRQRRSRAA